MEYLMIALKLIIGLSILNVWLVRSKKRTPWRGGDAKTISEEFICYGLPIWFMWLVGIIKVGFALLLLTSIYYPQTEAVAAYGIAIFMVGAVLMHIKVGDPLIKSLPAFTFFLLSLSIALF